MHETKGCWYMNICILTKYAVFSSPVSHRLTHLPNLSMTWNHGMAATLFQEYDVPSGTLWSTYKKLWKDPPFSMGKSTINGHFQ